MGAKSPPTKENGAPAEWVALADLRPWKRNPRRHDDSAGVDALATELLTDTWGAPIVRQASSGRLIAGHRRRLAGLRILGGFRLELAGEVRGGPDWTLPGAPGPGYVPVRTIDVDDVTADRMALADNSPALAGRDDPDLLLAVLGDYAQRGEDVLAAAGYGDELVRGMLAAAADQTLPPDANGKEFDEDIADDVKTIPCPHCGGVVPLP